MGKVVCGMAVSLDGFVADRNGSLEPLYPDLEALRRSEMLEELIRTTGAVVMGRGAYDVAEGDLMGVRHLLLGSGLRFIEKVVAEPMELELGRVIEMPGVTYLWFRIGT